MNSKYANSDKVVNVVLDEVLVVWWSSPGD